MTKKIIKGAGGPRQPPPPYRAPDTLNSKQFATIQDLLSEGEIEGFATPSKAGIAKSSADYLKSAQKDIFLNNTPILNANASNSNPAATDFNFQGVVLDARYGTSVQSVILGIESSSPVNSSPIAGFPRPCTVANGGVTQAISLNKDAVKVTITFPQIQKAEDNGDLLGSSVELKIQLQTNNGTFTDKIQETITGRTADLYSREYRVNLPATYSQAAIKVVRVTADSTTTQLKDEFSVSVVQEIVDDPQTYPDSAYAQLRIDSEQFSSVPRRAYRIRGIKVRIPAPNGGLTPTVVANQTIADSLGLGTCSSFGFIHYPENYVFNGQMAAATWCSDPAMVLLDLLTTKRYGFGTHIAPNQGNDSELYENLDLYSFVAASRYCTGNDGGRTLLDDGSGGKEPRFSCNVNIQSSKEAFDLIKDLASIMRCIPVWSQGSISIIQDAPADPSYLFSLANVTPEGFSYTGSSLKQRHSVVSVSYFNMDSREIDFEVYGDGDTSAEVTRRNKLGIVYKQVKSFGCTSRGQAQRLARAIVFSEEQESEVINFSTSIDAGAIVRPGSIIAVNDPVRQGDRRSGRIAAATTTQITVDDTQDLSSFVGGNQKVSVIMPDGSVEQRFTTNVDSVTGVITINTSTPLSTTPNVNSMWLLESDGVGQAPQTFRVISVEEQDGVNYSISALAYRSDKYDNIESVDFPTLPARNISRLSEPKPAPIITIPILEEIIVVNNIAINRLLISWQPVAGVSQYQVQYRYQNTNWVTEIVFRPDIEIMNTQAGNYDIRVFSFNAAGQLSTTPSTTQFPAQGKTTPPNDVQNLTAEPVNNNLTRLRWDKSIDPDVLHGGRVYIRHSNKTDGTGSFQNSVDLIEAVAGNSTDVIVPSLEGEYILKFRDDGGRFSLGETSVIVDMPDIIDNQAVFTDREDTGNNPFNGNKTKTILLNGALKLIDPSSVITGTYSQSGNDITCTINSHAVSVGDTFNFTFTTGGSTNGKYPVTSVTNANVFVAKSLHSETTSGNVTVSRGLRGTYDFASILDLEGVYTVNLKRHFQSVGFFLGGDLETAIYTQSGTTVTINKNSHGRSVDDSIVFTATSGAGVAGTFQIATVSLNSFTYIANQSQTVSSSDCTFQFVNTLEQLIPNTSPEFGGPVDGGFDNYAVDGEFDGAKAQKTNAQILVASTSAAPSNGSSYQDSDFPTSGANAIPFNVFANGNFKGRGFKFKLKLSSEDAAQNISVEQAGYTATFEARTEQSKAPIRTVVNPGVDNTPAAKTVTFAKPFFTGAAGTDGGVDAYLPSIGITIQNASQGEFFQITNVTKNGFTCAIKNGNGNLIDKEFSYQAVGYGKGV